MDYNQRQNDLLIGELMAKVNLLMASVSALEVKVDTLTGQANRGKGFMLGALLMAGGAGAALSEMIGKVFK